LWGSLIPGLGAATAFIMRAATWTDQDERPLSDPSGSWSRAIAAFLILGFVLCLVRTTTATATALLAASARS